MAIYHLSAKTLSRSKGESAANAIAYESGVKLQSPEKEVDFSKKETLTETMIIGTDDSLQELCDKMELAERRKNSTVGRRMTIALPHELNLEQQKKAVKDFSEFINKEHGVALVANIHAPDKGGDEKNVHAHITFTDRRIDKKGELGEKCRELSCMSKAHAIKGTPRAKHHLNKFREKWADIANASLEKAGETEKIDHRSLKDQGIDRAPQQHQGKVKTDLARNKGDKYQVDSVEFNKKTNEQTNENRRDPKEKAEERKAPAWGSSSVDSSRMGSDESSSERNEAYSQSRNITKETDRERFDRILRESELRSKKIDKRRLQLEQKRNGNHFENTGGDDDTRRAAKLEPLSKGLNRLTTSFEAFGDGLKFKSSELKDLFNNYTETMKNKARYKVKQVGSLVQSYKEAIKGNSFAKVDKARDKKKDKDLER